MSDSIRFILCIFFLMFTTSAAVRADDHADPHGAGPASLHFSHPLVSESPSPDTKVRLDYALMKETAEEDALVHQITLEGEYAPVRWMSFEINVPYTVADRDEEPNRHNLDNLEVAIKLANFWLEDEGVLLGGGLELGLPTGNSSNDIGSDRLVEIEPFVNMGVMRGDFEWIGFLKFGFPENSNSDDPDFELGWNASLLYHVTPMLEGLVEFDGERVWGGEEDGETIAHVTPGVKLKPLQEHDFKVGTGVSIPITNDEEFDLRWIFSVFYHF